MNNYKQIDAFVAEWKSNGLSKEKIIANCAEAELGWPYVWGACAAQCTTSKREYYANRDSCPAGEKKVIKANCPVLSGKQQSCDGCQWFPNGERVLIDDCWGFAKQVLSRVGISLSGYGCTSGWNAKSNWSQQGVIADMPNVVCLVFVYDKKNKDYSHVGIHIGGGGIIHCSGTVKRGNTSEKMWTHYAIPNGLEGGDTPMPDFKPTIRKGSTGEYVTLLQTKLIQLGYDLGSYGADGKFGNKTFEAVKQFQKAHGLIVDGVVGPMTWDALDNAEPGKKYTVTIPNLEYNRAVALKNEYAGAEMTEERG